MVIDIIDSYLSAQLPDAPRDYVGASSIGNDCKRAIWYGSKKTNEQPLEPRIKRLLSMGKIIEDYLVDMLENCGLDVQKPHAFNNFLAVCDDEHPYFQGHMDATIIISGIKYVIDIKTCNAQQFALFIKKGLRDWSTVYYSQLQSYMGMTGIKYAILLAYNKDTSALHEEVIQFNPIYYAALREKARMIYESMSPPGRLSESPMFFKCRFCNYQEICHG